MKTGLLGYPIEHSLSPAIHNAAYQALGLDWEYGLYSCPDRRAFDAVVSEALREPGVFVGFNVTTPYKAAAFELAYRHSFDSEMIECANVLTVFDRETPRGPLLKCDITDGIGLITSLKRDMGAEICNSSVVVCGTGPVGMAVLQQLLNYDPVELTVASRNAQAAQARIDRLCERLVKMSPRWGYSDPFILPQISVIEYGEIAQCLLRADVLIDATTVGMNPTDGVVVPVELLRPSMVVVDVVYSHGETALVKAAREIGAKAFDGLGMLVEQAALTIEIWALEQERILEAPRDLMLEVARRELGKHRSIHCTPHIPEETDQYLSI